MSNGDPVPPTSKQQIQRYTWYGCGMSAGHGKPEGPLTDGCKNGFEIKTEYVLARDHEAEIERLTRERDTLGEVVRQLDWVGKQRDRLRAALELLVNAVARELPTGKHVRQAQAALYGERSSPSETEACQCVQYCAIYNKGSPGCRNLPLHPRDAEKATAPPVAEFVSYDNAGGVHIDLNAYLRSPSGQAQLKTLQSSEKGDGTP